LVRMLPAPCTAFLAAIAFVSARVWLMPTS
jgi:hypothetical protein